MFFGPLIIGDILDNHNNGKVETSAFEKMHRYLGVLAGIGVGISIGLNLMDKRGILNSVVDIEDDKFSSISSEDDGVPKLEIVKNDEIH